MQLIFDFDGTLADSSLGIYASFEHACDHLQLTPPPFITFRKAIGPPVQILVKQLFPDLQSNQITIFRNTFRGHYDQEGFRQCSFYADAASTLSELIIRDDLTLSIVTNKPTQPTNELLRGEGLSSYFQHVIGIDYCQVNHLGSVFQSKTEALVFASQALDAQPSECVYVGDTPSDGKASMKAGLAFIAATYGFHQWSPSEANGYPTIDQLSALKSRLDQLSFH